MEYFICDWQCHQHNIPFIMVSSIISELSGQLFSISIFFDFLYEIYFTTYSHTYQIYIQNFIKIGRVVSEKFDHKHLDIEDYLQFCVITIESQAYDDNVSLIYTPKLKRFKRL